MHGFVQSGADTFDASILIMETRTHRRISRNRKKTRVPLSKLRTSEAVRTVVAHPRRLAELVTLLDDPSRPLRGRAAATLARLSESYPGRLVRIVERLHEALSDDSAYVRWHLVYTLGRIGSSFPVRAPLFLPELVARLDDGNRIVRTVASQALSRLALRKPQMIKQLFESTKHDLPPSVARVLRRSARRSGKA